MSGRHHGQGEELQPIFKARSVAIVGASATPGKIGNTILKNIVESGYTGQIYPVNPRGGSILGYKAYPRLSEINGQVDLGVFAVPAEAVPELILEGKKVGMRGAVVISGGFGEIGNVELEKSLIAACREAGLRLIGPNCQGINYTPNRLCATWPLVRARGNIGVISQSGTVGAAISGWAEEEGLGISGFVGLGNKADVSELELMKFFSNDSNTHVIALYLERVKDGRAFRQITRRAIERGKKIVALKGGRTPEGRRAAQSHTRSIAGSFEVFSAVCRDLGIITAKDVESLYDSSKAAALLPRPNGPRIMIITSSGGSGILAADAVIDCGMTMATLTYDTIKELEQSLPPRCVIANPLDLTGDATSERFALAASIVGKHGLSDAYLFIYGDPIPGAAEAVLETRRATGRPVAAVYIGGGEVQKGESIDMHRKGIPVFPTPERAIRAIHAIYTGLRG